MIIRVIILIDGIVEISVIMQIPHCYWLFEYFVSLSLYFSINSYIDKIVSKKHTDE